MTDMVQEAKETCGQIANYRTKNGDIYNQPLLEKCLKMAPDLIEFIRDTCSYHSKTPAELQSGLVQSPYEQCVRASVSYDAPAPQPVKQTRKHR